MVMRILSALHGGIVYGEGECKGNRGLSDRCDRDKCRLAGDPKFSILCNNILHNLRT